MYVEAKIIDCENRLVGFYNTGSDLEIVRDYNVDGITSELALICSNETFDLGEINKIIITKEEGIKEIEIESRAYRK